MNQSTRPVPPSIVMSAKETRSSHGPVQRDWDAVCWGSAPPTRPIVTFVNGGGGDICIGLTQFLADPQRRPTNVGSRGRRRRSPLNPYATDEPCGAGGYRATGALRSIRTFEHFVGRKPIMAIPRPVAVIPYRKG